MINRLVGVVAALCIVLLAAPAPSGAIADVPGLSSVTHSYCTPVYDQPNSYTAPERGPPTTYDHAYACNADVRWSRGVLARPGGSTSFAQTTYDDRVVLAPEAPVTTTAGGGVEVTSGGLVSPERVHVAANSGKVLTRYDPDFALGQLTSGGRASASQLDEFGAAQGWARSQTATGPVKYTDANGVVRLTIKRGSPRAPGSGGPHVELRNADGYRVDPYGNLVTRKSPGNHTPIEWDW